MRRRPLPGTDLSLSVLGLGLWAMGGKYWGPPRPDEDAVATLQAALDLGVNWFDTAPLYGEGHADTLLRRAFGPRLKDVIVATKVGVRWRGAHGHAESDLSPAHIVEDAEASLTRLGLETIPLLQVHWPCERGTPLAETLGALTTLQTQGKIQHFGLCNYGPEALAEARALAPIVSLQTPYSLLRRELEGPLLAAASGLGVLAYEPLCRGLLSGKYTGNPRFGDDDQRSWDERFQGHRLRHAQSLTAELGRIAARVGVPTSAVAIGWAIAQPGVTAVIAGARTPQQLRENVQADRVAASPKVVEVISRVASVLGGV